MPILPMSLHTVPCCSGEAFLREHPVQLPHRGVQRRDRGGDGQDYEHIGGGGKININNYWIPLIKDLRITSCPLTFYPRGRI